MSLNIDWDNLSFSITPAKTMFVAKCAIDGEWDDGKYLPYGDISISPAACILNYGQGLFEGLKAQRTKAGKIVLFRPNENGIRMQEGARRICLAEYPVEKFVKVIKKIVIENEEYIPPYGKGSLYIRPCLWGTGPILGVSPAPEYTFIVYVSPVGQYFKTGFKPIKLEITTEFHRAAPHGTGHVKYIGNYASGMLAAKQTKAKGFNEVIYLDAREDKYIEEVGAANFFCIKGNRLMTPKTGSILSGITRKSVLQLAADMFDMEVSEQLISVEDALSADEVFCAGTATVISSIGSISYKGKETIYNDFTVGPITQKIYDMLTKIQLQEVADPYGWVVEV
jgi:branched-chain amino acid aminotransferase